MEQLSALWKYLISFTKKKWGIDDYPLRYRHQFSEGPDVPPWIVQIINWWGMTGFGNTKQEAYQNLRKSIERKLKKDGLLPRPGTKVPIEFASTEGIEKIEKCSDIVNDFLEKILGFSEEKAVFISDESSLWDFHREDSNEEYYKKIKDVYGVDVSDIKDGNLLKIFKRIGNRS